MKFTAKQLKDFASYVRVQRSGAYNMLDPRARMAAGLSTTEYAFILDNYDALAEAAAAAGSAK